MIYPIPKTTIRYEELTDRGRSITMHVYNVFLRFYPPSPVLPGD